jgi:hypothetical protein
MVGEQLVAEFDMDGKEVYDLYKILPSKTRAQKQGNTVVIKSPGQFRDCFDGTVGTADDSNLLSALPWL